MREEWIEPSVEHQTASKLEGMTKLQKMYYDRGDRQRLLEMSQQKIKMAEMRSNRFQENYYYALTLADMSIIHESLGELGQAAEKMESAIRTLACTQSSSSLTTRTPPRSSSFTSVWHACTTRTAAFPKS